MRICGKVIIIILPVEDNTKQTQFGETVFSYNADMLAVKPKWVAVILKQLQSQQFYNGSS